MVGNMAEPLRLTSIRFRNYKSFKDYSISFTSFNVLVGPNTGDVNLYALTMNSPVNRIDPLGLVSFEWDRFCQDFPWLRPADKCKNGHLGQICRTACWAAGTACSPSEPAFIAGLAGCGAAANVCSEACPL